MNSQQLRGKILAFVIILGIILSNGSISSAKPKAEDKGRFCTVLRTMARVYMAYGDYSKAQPLVEQALTLARTTNASDSELSLCLIDLAYVYDKQSKFDEAEQMCELGLQLQEKVYYKEHPYVAYTLRILGSIYQGQGKYQEARTILDRALAIMLKSHTPDTHVIAPFKVDIADVLVAQGDFQNAEAYYQEALDLINKGYGPEHLYTANVLGKVARLYTLQGRNREAEDLINSARKAQEKVYGPEHHLLVPTWLTMAAISKANEDYDQAEKLLQKALVAVEKKRGAEHPLAGRILSSLGELYTATEKYAEDSLGPNNDKTAMALNNLASLYIFQGKYSEAHTLCNRALQILGNFFDENHPNVVQVLKTLSDLYRRTGNVAEVAKMVQRIEEMPRDRKVVQVPIARHVE